MRHTKSCHRRGWVTTALVAALLQVAAVPALGWSARKPPSSASKPTKPQNKHPSDSARPPRTADAPLETRIADALTAKTLAVRPAVALLKLAVAAREPALAQRVAAAIEVLTTVPLDLLVDAAQALGSESAAGRRLWQKAWQQGGRHPQFGSVIALGLADAALAGADVEAARQIVTTALLRARSGQRRGLYERLAAIARLSHEVAEIAYELAQRADPDALVVAAALHGESGGDEAALQTLDKGWQRYPGHRALQAALVQLLSRMGRREELRAVIDQVLRLAPADPMPYMVLLDAHIAARDAYGARKLIDELSRRYPRHDLLLEGLVDREQRLGQEAARIRKLYEQLVSAAPTQAQYVEAFAEWLLSRGKSDEAMEVLAKLGQGGNSHAGLFKQAHTLIGHRMAKPAQLVVAKLVQALGADPKVVRLQAQLAELEGNQREALQFWLQLCKLPAAPAVSDRRRAADGRQAYAALLRRDHSLSIHRSALQRQLEEAATQLWQALLYLDLASHDDGDLAVDQALWLSLVQRFLSQWPADTELLAAAATGYLNREHNELAVAVAVALQRLDADAAEPLLQQLLDQALARGRRELATSVEKAIVGRADTLTTTVLLRLGDLHLRYGDLPGAAELYKRAATVRGDHRATAKLAALYRQLGQPALEDAALREVVQGTTDPDELEAAGQRLVTVALVRGRSAELVRWLDAITPQHARRDAVARLRSAAYDMWLRAQAVQDATADHQAPTAGPLGDALGSNDLAQQIRALRHMAAAKRLPPPALARQLGQSANPSIRRDVALVLGAVGSVAAADILRDLMLEGIDGDENVRTAQALAWAHLPTVPGLDQVLDRTHTRGDHSLEVLITGIHGSAVLADALLRWYRGATKEMVVPALLAMGAMAGRLELSSDKTELQRTIAIEVAQIGADMQELPRAAAALWALRASGHMRAAAELVRIACTTPLAALRHLALNLLAAAQPPLLTLELPAVGRLDDLLIARESPLRQVLAPWLLQDRAAVLRAVQVHQASFEQVLQHLRTDDAAGWQQGQQLCAELALAGADLAACH
ncbi:MAG: hypothetical protein EXR77_05055 [Myxococcales bacterium]|nr:hypothetical protein [Myxococcales bacterium]